MLRATFYGFNIAASGMMMAQKALDLTGNNMVNLDTTGYTRQRLDLNSLPSSTYTDRYAPYNNIAIGQGVNVTKVLQMRDPHLDNRFRNEAARIGELDSHLSVMRDISRVYDEVQFQSLDAALRDLLSSLQTYSPHTGEVTLDSTVAAKADAVLKMFNQYATQVNDVRTYHEEVLREQTVPEINIILKNLAELNDKIRECEIYGNPALELKDMRNLALDRLSAYMQISVDYYPDPDAILAQRGIEICRVSIITDNNISGVGSGSDGKAERVLVDGVNYTELHYEKVPAYPPDPNDPDRMEVRVYKQTPQPNEITGRLNKIVDPYRPDPPDPFDPLQVDILFSAGALRGAIDMLNSRGSFDDPPNNVNGIGYYEQVLDTLVKDFAVTLNEANKAPTQAYIDYTWYWNNKGNQAGWNAYFDAIEANGYAGGRDPYNLDTSDPFYEDPFTGPYNLTTPPPHVPNELPQYEDRPLFVSSDFLEYERYWNNSSNVTGWQAYHDYLVAYPDPNYLGTSAEDAANYAKGLMDPGTGDWLGGVLDDPFDPSGAYNLSPPPKTSAADDFTAKNIMLAPAWKSGEYGITTTLKIPLNPDDDVSGDTSNLLYIISLFSKDFNFTTQGIDGGGQKLYTGTFAQMFSNIGFTAAQDEYAKTKSLEASTQVILGIEDLRNSMSAVSMDEEGINLLRYQKSYNAAARVMTTLDEALDTLINRMGIVGR